VGAVGSCSKDEKRSLQERGRKSGQFVLGRQRKPLEDEGELLRVDHLIMINQEADGV